MDKTFWNLCLKDRDIVAEFPLRFLPVMHMFSMTKVGGHFTSIIVISMIFKNIFLDCSIGRNNLPIYSTLYLTRT